MRKKVTVTEERISAELESVIEKSTIHWNRSREEIWLGMEKKIAVPAVASVVSITRRRLLVAAAAVLSLLLGSTAFIRFYTKTVTVSLGEHAELLLPDGSTVSLNAQSRLSYKPLYWRFAREAEFEGEGFFSVMKGKSFEVRSDKGKTVVLGTSFNIYSRDVSYEVTCLSGKVKVVESSGKDAVILTAGNKSFLNQEGTFTVDPVADTLGTLSWMSNKFSFNSVPLRKVFEEIGRQYGVLISVPEDLDKVYSGAFMKEESVESVLSLVCRPFDLKYTRKSENEYILSGNNSQTIIQ